MTNTEIAQQLGIPEDTLLRWRDKHPEFRKALDDGGPRADGHVVVSLFKRATGQVKVPAVKVSFAKDGTPLYAPYVETLPPDVGAQKLWLYNRQPERWRDRREVQMTVSLEQQIAQLTPEERLERLRLLQAKAAGMLIEGTATEVEPDGEQ